MHFRVRMQTPEDWSKFLQDSPEHCITSLASPTVGGTQVPVRIHPEIHTVTVTDQKNKLHRILREDGEGEMLWAGVEGQGNSTLSVVTVHKWGYKNSSNMNRFARHHGDFRKAQAKEGSSEKGNCPEEDGSIRNVVRSPRWACLAPPSGRSCRLVYQNVLAVLGQPGQCWRPWSVMTRTQSPNQTELNPSLGPIRLQP